MIFSEQEIEIAKEIHELDLQWQPKAGHSVFDLKGVIEKTHPFKQMFISF